MSYYIADGSVITSIIHHVLDTLTADSVKVLFVRTPTTGQWLDLIERHSTIIERILYVPPDNVIPFEHTKDLRCQRSDTRYCLTLEATLDFFTEKRQCKDRFDLICIDGCHDFATSSRDFQQCASLLKESGILLSHDCSPVSHSLYSPTFQPGGWCGSTFIAFVHLVHQNPDSFYAVLDIDTGIGIFSKKKENPFQHILATTRDNARSIPTRNIFFDLHKKKKKPSEIFTFFRHYGNTLINLIDPKVSKQFVTTMKMV